jgi:hypothetical protein
MEETKLKVIVEVTTVENDDYLFDISAPKSLSKEIIRAILTGGLALSIRAEDGPKKQAEALKEVICHLESEFINPDSFSDLKIYE